MDILEQMAKHLAQCIDNLHDSGYDLSGYEATLAAYESIKDKVCVVPLESTPEMNGAFYEGINVASEITQEPGWYWKEMISAYKEGK